MTHYNIDRGNEKCFIEPNENVKNEVFRDDNNNLNDNEPSSFDTIKTGNTTLRSITTTDSLLKTNKNNTDITNNDLELINHFYGYLLGILCALCFSISNILTKRCELLIGSDHAFLRYLIQFIFISLLIYFRNDNKHVKNENILIFGPRDERPFLILRSILSVFTLILMLFASKFIDPSDIMALTNTSIILTALFSRFILNEKLTIVHIIALLFTIIGITCICNRPTIEMQKFYLTQNTTIIKNAQLNTNEILPLIRHSFQLHPVIGRILIVISSVSVAFTQMLMKRFVQRRVSFTVILLYPSIFGLPLSFLISLALVLSKLTHNNLVIEWKLLLIDVIYSICGALIAIFALIVLCISYKYEDLTRISITKSIDIVFSFIFQYIFLNIKTDLYAIIGALFISIGILFLLLMKLVQKKFSNLKGKIKFIFHKF